MKKLLITLIAFLFISVAFVFGADIVSAKEYEVKPATGGDAGYENYANIKNKLIRIGKEGGGTLVIKEGEYPITNTLYVDSNTTIRFEGAVTLKKDATNSYSSSTLFQLVPYAYKDSKNVTSKYNGVHDVKFEGSEITVFDMQNYNQGSTNAITLVMANNKNISIESIQFQNIKKGHFIEMDGCKNVSIKHCRFFGMADNKYHNKEAINLDTNDKKTGGFSQAWSKKDKTPNKNITIYECIFGNLVRAVGTHRYSAKKYHSNIKVDCCTMEYVKTPLGMLNWKNSVVKNNVFVGCKANKKYNYTIFMAGVRNLTFTKNGFISVKSKTILKYYAKYQTAHKEYKPTKSKLTKKNIKALKNNTAEYGTKRTFKIGKKKYKWKRS